MIQEIEQETKQRSLALKEREEFKMKNIVNSMIDIQLNKLESKL